MSINSEDINNLRTLKKNKQLIICCGPKVSTPSLLPSWEDLIKKFYEFGASYFDKEQISYYNSLLLKYKNDDMIKKNEIFKNIASIVMDKMLKISDKIQVKSEFENWILSIYKNKKPNELHKLIVTSNYDYILTSNYDDLLEKVKDNQYDIIDNYVNTTLFASNIYNNIKSIIHIHNSYKNINLKDFVLVAEDFREVIRRYPGFVLGLQTLFIQYSIIFIGYEISDLHFLTLLQDLATDFDWHTVYSLPQYFIVLESKYVSQLIEDRLKKYRIKIVKINDYSKDIKRLLEGL